MAVPGRHPLMTAEQLFELPDDGYRSELVEGEIVRLPDGGRARQQPRMWLVLRGRATVSALEQQFELEWRRATPLNADHVALMITALNQEKARSRELLERFEELEQRLSEVVSGSPSVWTPQADAIIVKLVPDQIEFLQRPLRGQGGYQTLLARLQENMDGDRLRLTRTDCERVVRYGTRYGQGGFQTRLQSIVQLAAQFIN